MDPIPTRLTGALTLTAAAGVLHLVAARAHVGTSWWLGAGFVAIGLIQVLLPLFARRVPDRILVQVLAVDLAALGAWAVSRTVGLPQVIGGEGAEAIAIGDASVVVLQLAALAMALVPDRIAQRVASATAPVALVAGLGAVAFAAPATSVHDHGRHPHGTAEVVAATPSPEVAALRLGFLGANDAIGDNPVADDPVAAGRMKALMTGIADDGRNGRTVALRLGLLGPNDRIGRDPFAGVGDAAATMKRWMTGQAQLEPADVGPDGGHGRGQGDHHDDGGGHGH